MARGGYNHFDLGDSVESVPERAKNFLVTYKVWILTGLLCIFFIATICLAARGPKEVIVPETPTTQPPPPAECNPVKEEERYSCDPRSDATEKSCTALGCCWKEETNENVPKCYFPTNYEGYSVDILSQTNFNILARLTRKRESGFPNDTQSVTLNIDFINEQLIRIKLWDPAVRRWEVSLPDPISFQYSKDSSNFLYDVDVSKEGILTVTRKSNKNVLIRSDLRRLIYSQQFMQIDWKLPADKIYGLSEHKTQLRQDVTWKYYTIFNRGEQPKDSGKAPNLNLYGHHPVYMMVEDQSTGTTHGVFLQNSNAMDVVLQPEPGIQWRVVGGVLDFFVYLGPSPIDVVKQHVSLVGRPHLPPYWMLGFHLARYGYNSSKATAEAYDRNVAAGVPLEAQWNDIDAFDTYNDFTIDPKNFSGLREHIDKIHEDKRHWVIILDPGISNKENKGYLPYDDGAKLDIFVKDYQGENIQGKVWNHNTTVFVDFTNTAKGWTYWAKQVDDFHEKAPFDALWVDMNEPYSFETGSINGCPDDPLESPPYVPGGDPLNTHTLCMTAQHALGTHYNVHSLYAHYETAATNFALRSLFDERPFVLSRANYAGHGRYGGHWTGDIDSSYDHMRWSIIEIIEFNMYGIPMIGADICGFQKNTTADLCARWQSLGSFYPFSRNHNDHDTIEQDPAVWPADTPVLNSTKKALELRYKLLPYLGTLMADAHTTGAPVIRPLFMEFQTDPRAYEIETQFMWGSALMIVPVLKEGDLKVNAYFPEARWYDVRTGALVVDKAGDKEIPLDLTEILVTIRGGQIVPTQDGKTTVADSREQPFRIIAALDSKYEAEGSLFWDDGKSIDTIKQGLANLINFSVKDQQFNCKVNMAGANETMSMAELIVYGMKGEPQKVDVNGVRVTTIDYKDNVLSVKLVNQKVTLLEDFYIKWEF